MAKTRRLGNLPAEATSFIGRRGELAELRKKLARARLVSIVGPGGVGKTRLAIRAASDLARGFRDGAWWLELADVHDPALVSNVAMTALDLRDQAAREPLAVVLAYLQDKELLLVVDNCEHLLGAAAELVSEVTRAAPGVRMIATSREPLSVQGEHVIPVPPLQLPSAHDAPLAQLRQNEAVMLFSERAAAASGKFELTTSNQSAVVDICRRLDGLPLALELAAVRTRVLTVEQIRDRLSDRFGLLTGGGRAALPRHQTLRTTIDWSHDLLSLEEQVLLRRLCVFAGRFTLEDVEGVCVAGGLAEAGALDMLSSLVDKSLVMMEDAKGLACYRLHETMREYAVLKLREAGEDDALGERCISYYVARSLRGGPEARYHLLENLEWMELEIDNVRAVLRHCVTREDFVRGIVLATSMGWYWITRATAEGVRWMDELLAGGGDDRGVTGWAYFIRGFLPVLQADPDSARPWLARAAATARRTGDLSMLAQTVAMASIAETMLGDHVSAGLMVDEAHATALEIDDPAATLSVLQARTLNGMMQGDLETVRASSSEGIRISRRVNDLYALDVMLGELGSLTLMEGDIEEARRLYGEALRIARLIDDRVMLYYILDAFAYLAATAGQARPAAQLLGAAETIRNSAGARPMPFLTAMLEQARESATAALGASRFDAEFKAGKSMTRDAAARLALGESPAAGAANSDDTGAGLLGRREADVAHLIAEGLSNKQIGARLFISERTVDSHVRSILNKLGFNSRAQIAGWVAAQH